MNVYIFNWNAFDLGFYFEVQLYRSGMLDELLTEQTKCGWKQCRWNRSVSLLSLLSAAQMIAICWRNKSCTVGTKSVH